MEIYFDNSATTRCCQEAVDKVVDALSCHYGNPSSMHLKGVEAEGFVKEAARTLASTLKAQPSQILFTSGATESNNLAIFGAARARQRAGRHLITTGMEHPSVLAPMERLREEGFEVTLLKADEQGCISLEELRGALREDTILVSMMMVNNEVGSLMPIQEAGKLIKEKSQALFHVDAVQGYGKLPVHPSRMDIDLLSASSHKFHGPKGCGFLYIGNGVRLQPQILGGGQQGGMRSGTDNVPGIAGMGAAAAACAASLLQNQEHLLSLKKRLSQGLSDLEDVVVNGPGDKEGAPHILNASFLGVRSEVLLHALEEKGIYTSAGSACSSHKKKPQGALAAMGLSPERRESALRFSFCKDNTLEEVDACLEVLNSLLPMLRRFRRR